MCGATQIMVMAGGGIASYFDPLDVAQYTFAELKAVVDAATCWNTYVTVHAYTPTAMKLAIEAGVRNIKHGNLMDEDVARLMADKDIWQSLQLFLDDADAIPFAEGSDSRAKQLQVVGGTDTLFSVAFADRQGHNLPCWPAGSNPGRRSAGPPVAITNFLKWSGHAILIRAKMG